MNTDEVPSKTGKPFRGPAGSCRFLTTKNQTEDSCCVIAVDIPPGGQAPWHTHSREDEVLHVVDGHCSVQIGSEVSNITSGNSVHLPRDVEHSFMNVGSTILRVALIFSPAHIEDFFDEVSQPLANKENPQLLKKRLAEVGARYGIAFRID